MQRFLVILVGLTVVACGRRGVEITGPPPTPDISGNWSGTSAAAGMGTLSFTLAQHCLILLPPGQGCQEALSGTWLASLLNAGADGESGSLSGQVSASTVILGLTLSNPGTCQLLVTATLSGAATMHGTYTQSGRAGTAACTGVDSGTVSLAKH